MFHGFLRIATLSLLLILIQDHGRGSTIFRHSDSDSLNRDTLCFQQDIFDLFKKEIKAPEIPARRVSAIVIPLIATAPATGLQLGGASTLSWTFGKRPETKLSAATAQVLWTTERQLINYLRTNMYLSGNRSYIQTDWRWYLFRLPTYGLGTGPADNIPPVAGIPAGSDYLGPYSGGKFEMRYNWIRFHNVFIREMFSDLFAGIGYHLDHYYDIVDEDLLIGGNPFRVTPHYAYCELHGFDINHYTASGLSLNFSYDTRDNIINPYKGIYVHLNYRYNFDFLGSSQNGSQLWTEFRTYVGLSKRIPRHLLAFWLFGSFSVSGHVPYLNLMSSGFDQLNSSARGYAQGRWRGEDMVYGEMEYRFPVSRCSGIIGGVLFANVTTASNRDMKIPLFGYFKPGVGFGFRIMVGKYDRTNLLIDFGIGEFSDGLYLQAGEIF